MAADTFMTMLVCRLNEAGGLEYVAAGHEPPLLYAAPLPGTFDELDSTGLLLGAMDDSEYDMCTCGQLASGDVLVCFTDGLFEATNADGVQLGMPAVETTVREHAQHGADAVCCLGRSADRAYW